MDILQILVYILTIATPLVGVAVKIGQYTKTISDLTGTVRRLENKLNNDFAMLRNHEKRITKLEKNRGADDEN